MRQKLNYKVVYATWKNDGAMFQSKTNSNKYNIGTRETRNGCT
jgi:hypothetical protein